MSQIRIEYIKSIWQMSDESWKFFRYCGNGLLPDGTKPFPEPMFISEYCYPFHCNFEENVPKYSTHERHLIWARGIILCMGSANEWRHCYVTSSLIGWAHTQNDPLVMGCWINILDQIDCIIMRHIPFCNYYHINTSQLPPLGGHFNIKMLALTSIGIPFIKIRSMA